MSPTDPYAPPPPPGGPYGYPPATPAYDPYAAQNPYGYPPSGPYPQAYEPRKPIDGVSVASLITGLLGIWPAALVCSILGFRRTRRDAPQRGRGFAVAGLVLAIIGLLGELVIVLVIVAIAHSPSGRDAIGVVRGERSLISGLSRGDCFEASSQATYGLLSSVRNQSCSGAHDAEVIQVVDALNPDADYPGEPALLETAEGQCSARLTADRASHKSEPGLRLIVYVPNESEWDRGDTSTICAVHDVNGARRGSIAATSDGGLGT